MARPALDELATLSSKPGRTIVGCGRIWRGDLHRCVRRYRWMAARRCHQRAFAEAGPEGWFWADLLDWLSFEVVTCLRCGWKGDISLLAGTSGAWRSSSTGQLAGLLGPRAVRAGNLFPARQCTRAEKRRGTPCIARKIRIKSAGSSLILCVAPILSPDPAGAVEAAAYGAHPQLAALTRRRRPPPLRPATRVVLSPPAKRLCWKMLCRVIAQPADSRRARPEL
jgi:hypothetical protein